MHITHLILTRHFAGSERHAIELANAQSREHEVSLILRRGAAGNHADAFADRVAPNVRTVLVPDWWPVWHAKRAVQRLQPDVAHAHLSGACRALHGLQGHCLRVATLHIHYKPSQHASLDALVAVAPWQLKDIPTPLRAHSTQIDNWILPMGCTADSRARLRAEFGVPQNAWVFGAVGRAQDSKGLDVLIQAFEQAALPNAWLVVVGHGQALPKLRRMAGPRVVLPGFSREPKDWMSAFDAFVSPARFEPFGLVLLEAMQAGLPVLATRTEGALHLAKTMTPELVPIDDAAALAQALRRIDAERPPRRVYDLSAFGIESKLAQLEAFYRRELAAQAQPIGISTRAHADAALRPHNNACTCRSTAGQPFNAPPMTISTSTPIQLLAKDLTAQGGVFCPNPLAKMALWNTHPRVFLDVAHTGQAKCPYCGTVYQLKPGEEFAPH